jgi:hypothetical protein
MTNIETASLSFKLMGIFSITQAIPLLRDITGILAMKNTPFVEIGLGQNDPSIYMLLGTTISISFLVLLGIYLLFFSEKLAQRTFTSITPTTPETELTAKKIQTISFAVIGIILIVLAIPKLVQVGANIQILSNAGDQVPTKTISAGTWAYSIGLAVQMFIGILLFLGANGLSSLWYFLQKVRPMSKINMER